MSSISNALLAPWHQQVAQLNIEHLKLVRQLASTGLMAEATVMTGLPVESIALINRLPMTRLAAISSRGTPLFAARVTKPEHWEMLTDGSDPADIVRFLNIVASRTGGGK